MCTVYFIMRSWFLYDTAVFFIEKFILILQSFLKNKIIQIMRTLNRFAVAETFAVANLLALH